VNTPFRAGSASHHHHSEHANGGPCHALHARIWICRIFASCLIAGNALAADSLSLTEAKLMLKTTRMPGKQSLVGLNPQPEPPGVFTQLRLGNPGSLVSLNPQPLPPKAK
jgi:hypothetical protein